VPQLLISGFGGKTVKLLFFVVSCFIMLLTGCGKEAVVIPPVMPTDVITQADADSAAGGKYKLKLNHNAVIELESNIYKAEYLAEPLGSGDPVVVTVTSPYAEITKDDIKEEYKNEYKTRLNKRKVEGLGDGAFLAYPSLYIYQDGYMIEISAGSGNSDEQKELLIELGKKALENLQASLSQYDK